MTPPTRFPRTAPPRKPLHERSDSHTNERTSPTLRIIGDPDAQIYTSSPFPTLPSHFLHPKNSRDSSQEVYEDEGGFSDDGRDYCQEHEIPQAPTASTANGKGVIWVEDYNGAAPQFPAAESSHYFPPALPSPTLGEQSTSSVRLDVGTKGSPITATAWDFGCERVSDEIIQLPSVPGRREALGSHHLTHTPKPMPSKSSDASLSSNESSATVIRTKPQSRLSRDSCYSVLPVANRPASSTSNYSSNPARSDEDGSPGSSAPPKSPNFSSYSSPDLHRSSSTSTAGRVEAAVPNEVNLQYPVVHSPTVAGSWAESIPSTLTRPSRAASSDRWNPHLSTVNSEDTDSRSGTMSGSGRFSFPRNTSNDPDMPAPLRVTRRSRDFSGSTIRIVNERDDNLTALPPIPGSRDSTFAASRTSCRSNRRNTLQPRPSTRGSFLRDSIPAWARIYYARHGSSTENVSSRPPTSASISSENHFNGISHPRNRPFQNKNHDRNRNSLIITPVEDNGTVVAEVRGEPRRKVSQVWSPHLWHDRSCMGKRRTVFKAPSIDEQAGFNGLSRRNIQILMFTLGFIFPFAWFIASFLPLPPKPISNSKAPQRRLSRLELARDLEKALGHVDSARYENARWWRNLNRWMSLLGVLVLVAVIALAAVAVHIKK